MIFKVEQAKTNFCMVWIASELKLDKVICTAIAPFEQGQVVVEMDYDDGEKNRLCYNPSDTTLGIRLMDRLAFKLLDRDTQILGTIRAENQKVDGFLQSYPYRVLQKGDETYFLYEVGFGGKGLFLCIYRGDELIAIAEKELTVRNYKDSYTVYASSADDLKVLVPMIIQYDLTAYGDVMELSVCSAKKTKVKTFQKELLAKYDPDFICRVKGENHA